jgi:hypothetical protein
MNSKQDKLFVKRNIIISNRIHEDIELKQNINTISQTSEDSWRMNVTRKAIREETLEKHDEQAFHSQLKPLLVTLRVLGFFPVDFPTSGE